MKYISIIISIWLLASCTTKDNFIDTGVSNGVHEGSIYEYLHTSSYNWDSTILVIERAGLIDLFSGKDSEYPQITFWGPTNHSIRRYLYENDMEKVEEMDIELCRNMILKHIVKGKFLKDDIDMMKPDISSDEIKGGTKFTCLGGNLIHAYRTQPIYNGGANVGPTYLFLRSISEDTDVPLASPDIQCDNGVVHSLNYNYTFGDI